MCTAQVCHSSCRAVGGCGRGRDLRGVGSVSRRWRFSRRNSYKEPCGLAVAAGIAGCRWPFPPGEVPEAPPCPRWSYPPPACCCPSRPKGWRPPGGCAPCSAPAETRWARLTGGGGQSVPAQGVRKDWGEFWLPHRAPASCLTYQIWLLHIMHPPRSLPCSYDK